MSPLEEPMTLQASRNNCPNDNRKPARQPTHPPCLRAAALRQPTPLPGFEDALIEPKRLLARPSPASLPDHRTK
jgi:hypothetical protein